jgi:hypothetical protein
MQNNISILALVSTLGLAIANSTQGAPFDTSKTSSIVKDKTTT